MPRDGEDEWSRRQRILKDMGLPPEPPAAVVEEGRLYIDVRSAALKQLFQASGSATRRAFVRFVLEPFDSSVQTLPASGDFPVWTHPGFSCTVLSCLALSCLALSCLVLSCLALSCLVLSCRVLSCLALCLALPCLGLFCLVLPCTLPCLEPCLEPSLSLQNRRAASSWCFPTCRTPRRHCECRCATKAWSPLPCWESAGCP
jgi:hypothetical protein